MQTEPLYERWCVSLRYVNKNNFVCGCKSYFNFIFLAQFQRQIIQYKKNYDNIRKTNKFVTQ